MDCSEAAVHSHSFFNNEQTKNYNHRAPKNSSSAWEQQKNVKVSKSKYKYNTLKNSERIIEWLLLQEHLVVAIKTC